MRRFFLRAAQALLFVCALAGCRSHGPQGSFDPRAQVESIQLGTGDFAAVDGAREIAAEWLVPSRAPYRLGVGDWVGLEIAGIEGSRSETFVMPDGRVYFDLAGGVKAVGLTVPQLGEQLEQALRRDYSSPAVHVNLRKVSSRRAWLLGRLNKPGLYPLGQPTTLLEGISLAGGLFLSRAAGTTQELADLGSSFVLREGKVLPIDFTALIKAGDLSQNIYLQDGDYVYFPSSLSQNVQILGEVRQPRSIGYSNELNLVAALAKANGPTADAHLDRVLIIRGSLSEPKVAVVDVTAILAGRASNVRLRPFDIVWVPDRPFKLLERYFWVIFDSAAATIAVREGVNAVERSGTAAPSITIPIGP